MNPPCDKPFVIPIEIFNQLDPIEKIVIRDQIRRGLVKIIEPEVGVV